MLIKIQTISNLYIGTCTEEEFGAIMANLENTATRLFLHMPTNIMKDTYILKANIICVSMEVDSGRGTEKAQKNKKAGRPNKED